MSLSVLVDLGDGSTLQISSYYLDRSALLAALSHVKLVTEDEWRTEYRPRLAIVPLVVQDDGTGETVLAVDPPDTVP